MLRLALLFWLLLSVAAFATTFNVTCSGDITSTLTTAIGSAVNGDIVNIGSGSCSIGTGRISVTNKAITIQGQGQGVTTIAANTGTFTFTQTGTNSFTWRLTAISFTFDNSIALQAFQIDTTAMSSSIYGQGGWRIDHTDWTWTGLGGSTGATCAVISGYTWGLIDHNNFVFGNLGAICLTTQPESTAENGTINNLFGSWLATQPYVPGSSRYLYLEDNVFTSTNTNPATTFIIDTGYSGCRDVLRHNTAQNMYMYAHWTSAGSVNSCFWEMYNNTFNQTVAAPGVNFGRMQGGGTGIFYNNTVSANYQAYNMYLGDQRDVIGCGAGSGCGAPLNACVTGGPQTWDNNLGDASAPGWPCYTQTGRQVGPTPAQIAAGTKQTSFPFYFWNNGPQVSCASGTGSPVCDNTFTPSPTNGDDVNYVKSTGHTVSGGGQGQGDVDFCVRTSQPSGCGTHTLTYAPWTYPYPLTAGGLPDPTGSPPVNPGSAFMIFLNHR